jgi:hypothetical protein
LVKKSKGGVTGNGCRRQGFRWAGERTDERSTVLYRPNQPDSDTLCTSHRHSHGLIAKKKDCMKHRWHEGWQPEENVVKAFDGLLCTVTLQKILPQCCVLWTTLRQKILESDCTWRMYISNILFRKIGRSYTRFVAAKIPCYNSLQIRTSEPSYKVHKGYSATHVFSTTPSLQKKRRCAREWSGGKSAHTLQTMYTFLDSTDLVESKNICLDFLACLNQKFEIFEVMHLEHPPMYPIYVVMYIHSMHLRYT